MAALDLKAVMQALADALVTVDAITKAHPRPTEGVDKGEAVVGFPTAIAFNQTFRRGSDRVVHPVWVILGLWDSDETLDAASELLADGAGSAVTALERDGTVTVRAGAIERYLTAGGIVQAALRLDCEVLT